MKYIHLCILFFGICSFSYSQVYQFEKATVIYNDGSTEELLMEVPSLYNKVNIISIKRTKDGDTESLAASKVKYIKIPERGINLEWVEYRNRGDRMAGKDFVSYKFGEVIVEGYIKLIKVYLNTSEFDHSAAGTKGYLFLLQKDGESTQLDVLATRKLSGGKVVHERYKGILTYFFQDCPDLKTDIRRSSFTDLSIIGIIKKYDECEKDNSDNVQSLKIEEGNSATSKGSNNKQLQLGKNYSSRSVNHAVSLSLVWPYNEYLSNSLGVKGAYSLSYYNESLTRNIGTTFELGFAYVFHEWAVFLQNEEKHQIPILMTGILLDWYPNRVTKKLKINFGFSLLVPGSNDLVNVSSRSYFALPIGIETKLMKNTNLRLRFYYTQVDAPPGKLIELGLVRKI